MTRSILIYPNGQGHFALGSPDGATLLPGKTLSITLAGHQITGIVQHSEHGDYLQAPDGTTCGLCAQMQVVSASHPGIDREQLGAYLYHDRCWIDVCQGEALLGHHFALFRLPAAHLPAFLCPASDGTYAYSAFEGHVLREEDAQALWLRPHWRVAQTAPTVGRCLPTEIFDCPLPGVRYQALIDEESRTRWIDARLLAILAPTSAQLAAYRFEEISSGRFRVFGPDEALPVAIISERVKGRTAW